LTEKIARKIRERTKGQVMKMTREVLKGKGGDGTGQETSDEEKGGKGT